MRMLLILAFGCLTTAADAQQIRVIPLDPGKKRLPLPRKDTTGSPYFDLQNEIGRYWKGVVIDTLEDFNVHQLPLDRMKCLVPNEKNPAMARAGKVPPQKPEAAQIPNGFSQQKIIRR
jgi:hypothetical protein